MDSTFSDITNKLEQVTGGTTSLATHVGGGAASSTAALTSSLSSLSSGITNITNNNNQNGLNNPTTMLMLAMAMGQRNKQTQVVEGPGFTSWRSSW
jgi:phage-related protein